MDQRGRTVETIFSDRGLHKTNILVDCRYLSRGWLLHIVPKGLTTYYLFSNIFDFDATEEPDPSSHNVYDRAFGNPCLGAYGLISLPPRLVEPMIAFSIVYVAFQNLLTDQLSRHRLPVIFGFGLLHGLGFASILTEFGLPETSIWRHCYGLTSG